MSRSNGAGPDVRGQGVSDALARHRFEAGVVFNLPDGLTSRDAARVLPAGAVHSRTDFGAPGYRGPCPPQGHGPRTASARPF